MELGAVTPIFRMYDIPRAKEFYEGFLEFTVDWEHRFDENSPVYMQVSKDGCVIHLSEHHGDGSPGAAIRVAVTGLDAYHRLLLDKNYKYYHPGICDTEWGTRETSVQDPFGNRITFFEAGEGK